MLSWRNRQENNDKPKHQLFDVDQFRKEMPEFLTNVPLLADPREREEQNSFDTVFRAEKRLMEGLAWTAQGMEYTPTKLPVVAYLANAKRELDIAYEAIEPGQDGQSADTLMKQMKAAKPLHSKTDSEPRKLVEDFTVNVTEAIASQIEAGKFSEDSFLKTGSAQALQCQQGRH